MNDETTEGFEVPEESINVDLRIQKEADWLRQFLTFEQAIQSLAAYRIFSEETKKTMRRVRLMTDDFSAKTIERTDELCDISIKCVDIAEANLEKLISTLIVASSRGKTAADVLHNKPGGNRAKRNLICNAWASGKYSSRDVCAEQECAALNMSFSTARKALIGTPKPT
jgi:hypothetical protein